jgi:GT2 family glycosyltransferase
VSAAPHDVGAPGPTVTVLICAYTERRWDQLVTAVGSAAAQSPPPTQIVLAIDHNPALLTRAQAEFPTADVMANRYEQGLSGARNTGVEVATGDVIAFLDDDACADPDWLEALVAPYGDAAVIGTGGVARAAWPDDRPAWFPREFDWVVGCSYRGLPEQEAEIRNPIGANMSFRRSAFTTAGGFQTDVGRVGTLPLGCEETEFSIRLRALIPGARIIHVPGAMVDHFVSADRTKVDYFLRRCIAEGLSKAAVTAHVGREQGLASERAYVTKALPTGFLSGLIPGGTEGRWRPARSAMIAVGLAATTVGYVLGRLGLDAVASRLAAAPKPRASTG